MLDGTMYWISDDDLNYFLLRMYKELLWKENILRLNVKTDFQRKSKGTIRLGLGEFSEVFLWKKVDQKTEKIRSLCGNKASLKESR